MAKLTDATEQMHDVAERLVDNEKALTETKKAFALFDPKFMTGDVWVQLSVMLALAKRLLAAAELQLKNNGKVDKGEQDTLVKLLDKLKVVLSQQDT